MRSISSYKKYIARLLLPMLLLPILSVVIPIGFAAEPKVDIIDINSAGVDVLAEKLSGIGPAKAKAIVIYRQLHGPFKTVDELINVKGIGPRTLEKIRAQLVVSAIDQMSKAHNAIAATASRGAQYRTRTDADRESRRAVQSVIDIARRSRDEITLGSPKQRSRK